MLKRSLITLAVIVAAIFSCEAAQEKRALTPEDIVSIRGLNDVQVSADGKEIAFVVLEPADPDKPDKPRDSNIWLVPTDGSEAARPYAASPKSDTSPRWSPSGRYLAFLSDRGAPIGDDKEAKTQIYLLRTDGGEAERLTDAPGGVEDFVWSHDGSMIAFTARDPLTAEEKKKHEKHDDEEEVDRNFKYTRVWVLTLADRKTTQVTKQDFNVNDFSWSPDGSELALVVSATPRTDDVFRHSRLIVVRRETGEAARTLSDNVSNSLQIQWSPDGRTILFAAKTPQRISSWFTLIPAAGGEPRYLLRDYPGTVWGARWTADSKHLIGEGREKTKAELLRIDAATGATTRLADINASGDEFGVSEDGRTIAYAAEAPDNPGNVWALTQENSPRRLTNLNPQIASLRLGEEREITWKNKKDGQTLYGLVITPPDFKPGRMYPAVVQVHGGPQWAWWSGWLGSWHEWAQLLANHGYVVFYPNPRGSTGQGWQFAEANRDDWGGADLQDILDGVDELVNQKIADPDRLGIGGWSYGGYMTMWTVTQTNRFRAAIAGAGLADLISMDGTTDIPSALSEYFVDNPFRRWSDYEKHSGLTYLTNCKTPVLVLHGGADKRVPTAQGWQFYNGLRELGVPVEMVVYPREPHGFRERAHQIDLLNRVVSWYDSHLKNSPPQKNGGK